MSPDSNQGTGSISTGHCPKILAFHKLASSFTYGISNYSPRRFVCLLSYMEASGLKARALSEVISGNDPRALAITFDDGYQHLLDVLPPLIGQFSLKPTVFVPTAYIGRSNSWDYSHAFRRTRHLDANELRQLADQGVEIGSHGHSHCNLRQSSDRSLRDELDRSKKTLEDILGRSIKSVSYPFGRHDKRVRQAADQAGYSLGFTMRFPVPEDVALAIGRYPIYGFDTRLAIERKITGGTLSSIEHLKSRLVNRVSVGTDTLNRLRRKNPV